MVLSKEAWVTLLTRGKEKKYYLGVLVLARSLKKVQSQYPLVVVYTPSTVEPEVVELLSNEGCLMRETDFILPEGKANYMFPRFGDNWTKLRAWELEELNRVVLLDADMLVVRNMDELMKTELEDGWIAGCHACTCNPLKYKHYPVDWTPENCAYTNEDRTAAKIPPPISKKDYFNGGLIVLNPSKDVMNRMIEQLSTEDLAAFRFAEQDLLNIVFKGKWRPVPYIYNALKTLRYAHAPMWHDDDYKNIHYILNKPWDDDWNDESQKQFHELNQIWWDMYTHKDSQ